MKLFLIIFAVLIFTIIMSSIYYNLLGIYYEKEKEETKPRSQYDMMKKFQEDMKRNKDYKGDE